MRVLQYIIAEQLAVCAEVVRSGVANTEDNLAVHGGSEAERQKLIDFKEALNHIELAKLLLLKHARPAERVDG